MSGKLVTSENVEYWSQLYKEGCSCGKIAEKTGYSKTAVIKHLRSAGILQPKKHPTPEMIGEWIEAFNAGQPPRVIAQTAQFSEETIRQQLLKAGLSPRPLGGPSRHTQEEINGWIADYLSGMTFEAIANKYGVSSSTIRTHLLKARVESRKRSDVNRKVPDSQVAEWLRLKNGGLSVSQIAKQSGFSTTTIYDYLKKTGVSTKSDSLDTIRALLPEWYELYKQNLSFKEIGSIYGYSGPTVKKYLTQEYGELNRQNINKLAISEEEVDDWIYRYSQMHESLNSIAKSAGVTGETVKKRLTGKGVVLRNRTNPYYASSWPEWAIYYYLKVAFPEATITNNPRINTEEKPAFPDLCISGKSFIESQKDALGQIYGVVIEYDGEHWHSSPEQRARDKHKTDLMTQAGYHVIRIIENSDDINSAEGISRIYCTLERKSTERGLGFAIKKVLELLGVKNKGIDLERDFVAISKLFNEYQVKYNNLQELKDLYLSGVSTNELSERYGFTPTTISKRLKQEGIEIRHKPHTNAEHAAWLEDYENDLAVPEIAEKHSVDKGTVYRYFKSLGITFEESKITKRDLEWKEKYLANPNITAIAEKYGVSFGMVKLHLLRMGVEVNEASKVNISEEEILSSIEAYNRHEVTYDELAEKYGVSAGSISRLFSARGVVAHKEAYNKTPKNIEAEILKLNSEKVPIRDICRELGIEKSTIYRILKRNDASVGASHFVTPELVDEWKKLYLDEKLGCKDIGAKYGFNRNVVSQSLRAAGVEMRQGGKGNSSGCVTSELVCEMRKLKDQGFNYREIGDLLGVSNTTVRNYLRELLAKELA